MGLDGYYLRVDQAGLVHTEGPDSERRHSVGLYSMAEGFMPGAFIRSAPPASPSVFVTVGTTLQL